MPIRAQRLHTTFPALKDTFPLGRPLSGKLPSVHSSQKPLFLLQALPCSLPPDPHYLTAT